MTLSLCLRLGAKTLLLCTAPAALLAQENLPPDAGLPLDLDPITVEALSVRPAGPATLDFDAAATELPPAADGGDLLRAVPGVTAGRMGGHGLELVIRGQSRNQLNVIDAGSFTYGGCPNRMDPPAATANFAQADNVTVARGYQSVTNGPGASGGAVVLERTPPTFEEGKRWSLDMHAGGEENGGTLGAGVSGAVDLGGGFYLEGFAEAQDAGNYEDGDGRTVRSAYTQKAGGLTFGYADGGTDLALDIERDRTTDVLFPGAGMDSPLSETTVYRLRGGTDIEAGALRRIEASAYLSTVDHVMDNYSLRPVGMMAARTPSTSDTHGGKIEAQLSFGATRATVGVDLQSNDRDATLYAGPAAMQAQVTAANPAFARFFMWPDVTTRQTGFYAETETDLGTQTRLTLGARYDRVRASAGKAAQVPGGSATAPNDLYTTHYGTTFDRARTEDNVGGLARLDWEVSPDTTLYVGASRSVRTADAVERAMAKGNWVGNPDIAPEKHHQLDVGVEAGGTGWQVTASAYVDHVDDYILRDAFSVPGVTTYRNVSARLRGVELSGSRAFGPWELSGDATWTYGQNRSDGRPLAQIPPLQGKLALAYRATGWGVGARLNWATKQTRIDPARDPAATPGYATLDLFGDYELTQRAVLVAGVTNLTDRTYASHLSRSNLADPTMVQVNEPGRSVYLRLEARF